MARFKKRLLLLSTLILAIWLVWTPLATARDIPNRDRSNRPPPNNRHHDRGFDGASQAINVSGSVSLGEAINLELSIKPTDAVIERIEQKRNVSIQNFQNQISISLTDLIEFEDLTDNGLTEDDIVLSNFALNSSNLNDVVLTEIGDDVTYLITSFDNSFQMIIEINSTHDMPHDWKWSLIIEYDYTSATSKLAVLHELIMSNRHTIREQFRNSTDHPQEFEGRELREPHPRLPVFFRWDQSAMVDDTEIDVIATKYDESLSLSFAHGDIINYDPSIGVDQSSLDSIDLELIELVDLESATEFIDRIFSPTSLGIVLAIAFTALIAITTLIYKSKTN